MYLFAIATPTYIDILMYMYICKHIYIYMYVHYYIPLSIYVHSVYLYVCCELANQILATSHLCGFLIMTVGC